MLPGRHNERQCLTVQFEFPSYLGFEVFYTMAYTLFQVTITSKPEGSHLHNNEHFSKEVCGKLHANELECILSESHTCFIKIIKNTTSSVYLLVPFM